MNVASKTLAVCANTLKNNKKPSCNEKEGALCFVVLLPFFYFSEISSIKLRINPPQSESALQESRDVFEFISLYNLFTKSVSGSE
jgi:hypothetical protein